MGKLFIAETSGLRHSVAIIRALDKFFSNFANCVRGRAEGQKTFYTLAAILGELFIVEISGLCHFLALIHAQIILFSNSAKCVRARAEGQKTFFTLPSITREPLVVGSSSLRHFVAQSSLYSNVIASEAELSEASSQESFISCSGR